MKVGKVIGNLSLVRAHSSLIGKRFVLVVPLKLQSLLAIPSGKDLLAQGEELVAIDQLGVQPEDMVGVSEGAEAVMPFMPTKTPVDAYVSCLLDRLDLDANAIQSITKK